MHRMLMLLRSKYSTVKRINSSVLTQPCACFVVVSSHKISWVVCTLRSGNIYGQWNISLLCAKRVTLMRSTSSIIEFLMQFAV